MKMHLKTKYMDEEVIVSKFMYGNGRPALIAESAATGELVCKLTSNIPDVEMEDDEVAIKDYSENVGVLMALIDNGVVAMPHKRIVSTHVQFPVCKVLI